MTTESLEKLDVLARLEEVEKRLQTSDPLLGTHLDAIRNSLLKHEELVHMLTDQQISIYMAGMQKHINVQLVEEASRSKSPRGKKNSLEDF